MASFWKRWFGRARPAEAAPTVAPAAERLHEAIDAVRARLKQFLVTRSVTTGMLRQEKNWSVQRTNVGLFRLEAEGLSVLINTEPFLVEKDGKLQGLIRMGEADLCRAIASGRGPADFFRLAEGLSQQSSEQLRARYPEAVSENEVLPPLGQLLGWSDFDIQQLTGRVPPNTLAHVLVHSASAVESLLLGNLSARKMELLISELEALAQPGSRREMNPHTRLRGLTEFEPALREFRLVMREIGRERAYAHLRDEAHPSTGGAADRGGDRRPSPGARIR